MAVITTAQMDVALSDGDKTLALIADAGDMAVLRIKVPAGADFTETLEAANGAERCSTPHWIFVLSGELTIRYNDGRSDTARPGEFLHATPGHTALAPVDTEFVEVSPRKGARDLFARIAALATA